ncbi:hypothetical protein [Streptomyces sp. NPDC003393]
MGALPLHKEVLGGRREVLGDTHPAVMIVGSAVVDRLTRDGTIVERGTDSCRLVSSCAKAEDPANAGRSPATRGLTRWPLQGSLGTRGARPGRLP